MRKLAFRVLSNILVISLLLGLGNLISVSAIDQSVDALSDVNDEDRIDIESTEASTIAPITDVVEMRNLDIEDFSTETTTNIEIGLSVTHSTTMSRETQTITGYIQGSSGNIVPSAGEVIVRIPRASIGSIASISVNTSTGSPLIPLNFYQEGTDVVFPFTFDYDILNEAAQIFTFNIIFEVATFQGGGVAPDNPYEVTMTYSDQSANTEFSITPINLSKPVLSKIYYGSRESDSSGSFGNLYLTGQEITNSNKFILAVNYDEGQKDNVVVTDILPQGTTLAPNPSTWHASGNSDVIAGGIRIAEVSNPGEADNSFHYVSEDFVDNAWFDRDSNTLTVNFGNIPEGKAYFIEYALEVVDVGLFEEGKQDDGFSRNIAIMSFNDREIRQEFRLRIFPDSSLSAILLTKSVDKNVINLDENELIYTLHVNIISGTFTSGIVIEDILEQRMEFVEFTSDIPEFIDAGENNGIVSFVSNREITGPLSFSLSFKVNVENFDVGEQILNFATLVTGDSRLNTSTVSTRKIDGRIQIIKTDEFENRLGGAKFEILDSNDNLVAEGITSDEGEFLSAPLPVGRYQVKEIEAPNGYLLDLTIYDVYINQNSTAIVSLNIINVLDTEEPDTEDGSDTEEESDKEELPEKDTQPPKKGDVSPQPSDNGESNEGDNAPDTSDSSDYYTWVILMLMSLSTGTLMFFIKKRSIN